MPVITAAAAGGQNAVAWLDMLAWSEIGPEMLADPRTDNGYKVLVGSIPDRLMLIETYAHHPRVLVEIPNIDNFSSAAGRYQFIWPTWRGLAQQLNLPDITPLSQDRAALELTRQCDALERVLQGDLVGALAAASSLWASLPGSTAGQGTHSVASLQAIFVGAGGQVSDGPP